MKKTTGADGKKRPVKKTTPKPPEKITLQAPAVTPKAPTDRGHVEADGGQVQVLAALLDAWDVATPVTRWDFLTRARVHDEIMKIATGRKAT